MDPPLRWRDSVGVPSTLDIAAASAAGVLVLLGTVGAATLQSADRQPDAGAIALILLAAGALAWRRRTPLAALGATVVLVLAYLLIGYPYGPIQLCMVFAMFEAARLRELRASLLACAAAVAATAAAMLSRALTLADTPALLLAVWASWLVIPWSIGALVRARSAARRRARRELFARAALEERVRVAREVHDVAGHGFAAVAMQAGVALLVFEEQPKQAKDSLEAIQSTSAKALAELRTTLDVFPPPTAADGGPPTHGSAPGLGDVAALVKNVRAAGLSVENVPVPEEIDRVAYRVVQEGLTNILRHAGPTAAEVRVRRYEDSLLVDVLDGGVGAGEVRLGRGLEGMRSRVAAAGGEVIAQPRKDGGFRVSARLPIPAEAT